MDLEGGYAKDGKIPWKCSDDLKRFKKTTTGNVCIMGRRTYLDMVEMMEARKIDVNTLDDILPGRKSFVLSRNPNFKAPGATVVPSIRQAWQSLEERDTREVFILGGERVFTEALAWTTKIYMNIIKDTFDCDKFFPVSAINKDYTIRAGEETDDLYQVVYNKRPKLRYQRQAF